MTHIGLDHRLTYYRKGGISTYITRLTQALSKLDQDNHYTVLYSRKERNFHAPSGMQAIPLWTPCHHRFERILLSAEIPLFIAVQSGISMHHQGCKQSPCGRHAIIVLSVSC